VRGANGKSNFVLEKQEGTLESKHLRRYEEQASHQVREVCLLDKGHREASLKTNIRRARNKLLKESNTANSHKHGKRKL
jgi:hypothetical protein